MKFISTLFFLLIFALSSYGFDCSTLENTQDCEYLKSTNEDLISNLIYTNTNTPDHDFIYSYNSKININKAPNGTPIYNKGIITAWLDILSVYPSVLYQNKTYIPSTIRVSSEYDYYIKLPDNYYNSKKRDGAICKIIYTSTGQSVELNFYVDNFHLSSSKNFMAGISRDSTLDGILKITASYQAKEYEWDRYCCRRNSEGRCTKHCYDCDYDKTRTYSDSLTIQDSMDVFAYKEKLNSNFQYISKNQDSTKGELSYNNKTEFKLIFPSSYFKQDLYDYSAVFIKKPFYLLQIKAEDNQNIEYRNLLRDNNTLFIKDTSSCVIETSNFFKKENINCNTNYTGEYIPKFEKKGFTKSWNLLFKIIIFLFVNYLIYKGIKNTWGKYILPVLMSVLIIPSAFASEECGLTNLASCIPQKMYDFFIDLLNAPLQPLLGLTRSLLENAPAIELFQGVWAIMVYVASLFYGFLFIYAGFQFLFSGHNVIKREMAKEWLKNTVIMITLIQGSFYLYGLVLDIGAILTSSVLSMVDESFFLITADNLINLGLEFLFLFFYVLTLFITILCLIIRYLIVAMGVIFAPLGIFCYFIPPLRSYGKLILNLLGTFIFITFVDAIIILACSMLIQIPLFANIKILIMISCFTMINVIFLILIIKAIFKAVFNSGTGANEVAQAVKYIAMIG
jgi:hypothetical protein